MTSTASIVSQRMKEGLGLTTRSSDPDLTAATERAEEVVREVAVLRKVLATSAKTALTTLASARQQHVSCLMGLAERLGVELSYDSAYDQYKRAHTFLDTEQPGKLIDVFDRAVLGILDEWHKGIFDKLLVFFCNNFLVQKYIHYF